MKEDVPTPEQMTKVLGLIVKSSLTSNLHLSRSLIPLSTVLPSIAAGLTEQQLFTEHPGLSVEEIKAARAYRVRFGDDLIHPAALPEGRKSLLLDENVPYTLLPLVTEYFGFSSHVEAEGLSRQNLAKEHQVPRSALDSRIARFAAAKNFAGILTADHDFAELYRHAGHPIRATNVILVDSREQTLTVAQRLTRHQHRIRQQLLAATPDLILI